MSISPTNDAALIRIAELAGSRASARSRLEQVLTVAREFAGLGSLSVIATDSASGAFNAWHSIGHEQSLDIPLIEQQALRALSALNVSGLGASGQKASRSIDKNGFVIALPQVDGYRAALVAQGSSPDYAGATFLQSALSFISLLVENARLEETIEAVSERANKRIEEIAAIYDIGQAIDATDAHHVLDLIVTKAASVMDAQTCSLMLRNQRDGDLVIEASYGLDNDVVKGARISFGEGIAGQVLETGEPMLITDVASDPRFMSKVRPRAGVSGSMCVPLKDEDGMLRGVLSIRRHDPNPAFTQDDLRLFGVFAMHASLALSNAQLYSRLHRKVQEMSTISDVMRAINSMLEFDNVLDKIVESITDIVGFDRCCVYLLDPRTGELVAGARKGYADDAVIKDRIKYGEGVIGLSARERIPIFSVGSPIESEGSQPKGEFLVAPILVRDQCIGVVVVDNCILNRPIDTQNVDLLATFVSQAGIAVENARLYEAMEEKYAELNVLYDHSKTISAAYGLENAAEMLVSTVGRAIRCDGAGLLLFDTRRDHLKLQASAGGMSRLTEDVGHTAQQDSAVSFVRELRSPSLLTFDSPERTNGPCADLLNTLAPAKSNLLLAPLVAEDTTIGVLALYRGRQEEFQGADFKLVSIIVAHAATVLKNAISYEQKMRQSVLEMTALYEFSMRISAAASLEEALDSILGIVDDLVDYDESFVYTIDQERGVVAVKAYRFRDGFNAGTDTIPSEESLDGGSVTSWAINERKAIISPDIGRDNRFSESELRATKVRSLMSIPLMVQDEVVGVLNVHSHSPNQYSEDDVRVVSIVASQGAAIYKALEALSALTSYTDNILSSIAAGVVTLDSDGTVLTWNIAAERIVRLKASRVIGLSFQDVLGQIKITDAERQMLDKSIAGVLGNGETYQGYKLSFHPRNQDEQNVNMNISQLLNSAGEQLGLVIIFEDVTREIKMENEFRRMGELAAIGQLAASIAHELRNPLSSIKGAAQFLQKEYEDHGSIVEFLGIIVEEVNGLNKLTTEFLDFARPMQLDFKSTNLNTVIERTFQLMSVLITDSNVVVKENLAQPLPVIEADSKQLQQVLKNIVINALQAMPEGGVLKIETGPAAAGGAYFSVGDTGTGISEDQIERIFQPFITTKTKGTGLGLSIVSKIIENHGGKIEVTSQVGKGTTFKVMLPQSGGHSTVAVEVDHTMERRVSGKLHWTV